MQYRQVFAMTLRSLSKGRTMKTSKILYKAVDILHERGWIQGAIWEENGGVCAVGAICVAATSSIIDEVRARDALKATVGQHIPAWNDAPERSFEDVLLAFKTAAYEAELKEAGE